MTNFIFTLPLPSLPLFPLFRPGVDTEARWARRRHEADGGGGSGGEGAEAGCHQWENGHGG